MGQFAQWAAGQAGQADASASGSAADPCSPLAAIPRHTSWGYLDYKHFADLFGAHSAALAAAEAACDWSILGPVMRDRAVGSSTFWFGTELAHTPCHLDTYGVNFVVQLHGHKKWVLVPPEESANMYPVRLPFEESSVWSAVDVLKPDLVSHPQFAIAQRRALSVVLEPGDVLFVPRHYWHFVRSLSVSVSVNQWVHIPQDSLSRLDEALARTVLSTHIVLAETSAAQDCTREGDDVTDDVEVAVGAGGAGASAPPFPWFNSACKPEDRVCWSLSECMEQVAGCIAALPTGRVPGPSTSGGLSNTCGPGTSGGLSSTCGPGTSDRDTLGLGPSPDAVHRALLNAVLAPQVLAAVRRQLLVNLGLAPPDT